jgi:uncharacterized protein YjbI with pentapeptide repeats
MYISRIVTKISGGLVQRISIIFPILAGVIGLAADFGTPWAQYLEHLCMILVGLNLVFLSLMLITRVKKRVVGSLLYIKKLAAVGFTYSLIAFVIIGPFYGLQRAFAGDKGLIAEHIPAAASLQSYLEVRFSRLEQIVRALNDDVVKVQEELTLSNALEIISNVKEARSGSKQGQAIAIKTLLSHGFDFVGADFSGVSLSDANLDDADFSESKLHFTDFSGASARRGLFKDADLKFAIADHETDFAGANLSGVDAPLFQASGVNFQNADLSNSKFFGADFRGADLRGANLTGGVFTYSDFREADLRNAKLDNANFGGTLLTDAKIADAIFWETNLLAATLNPSRLSDSQKEGVCRGRNDETRSELKMLVRWESNKYDGGYEIKRINSWDSWLPSGPVNDLSLRPCRESNQIESFYLLTDYVHFDRYYLSKVDRERKAIERFYDLRQRLEAGRNNDIYFTGVRQ